MKKQIKVSQTDHSPLDHTIQKILGESFPLPENVEHARDEALAKIQTMAAENEEKEGDNDAGTSEKTTDGTRNHRKIRKTFFQSLAGIGAAAAAFFCIYVMNSTVTAKVPIIERVFDEFGDSLNFPGDYTNLAEPVKITETGIDSLTVNGNTITLSEVYCNEATLYLSLVIHSEEKIPETYPDENGKPEISLDAMVDFDFDTEEGISWFNGGDTAIDGAMVDENTFAGVIRFEMGQYFSFHGTDIQVPEKFGVKLSIPQIYGVKLVDTRPEMPWELRQKYEDAMRENGLGLTDEDYEQFTEEQKDIEHQLFNDMWNAYYEIYPDRQTYPNKYDNWFMDGPWDFEFEVARNDKNVTRIDINDVDEHGLGIISVTKTPIEIAIEMEHNLDYFTIILDANGNLMSENAAGSQNTASISGYDTSKIYVYICDYMEYMDELKGNLWATDYEETTKEKTFKLLDERSLYHKEIIFDE